MGYLRQILWIIFWNIVASEYARGQHRRYQPEEVHFTGTQFDHQKKHNLRYGTQGPNTQGPPATIASPIISCPPQITPKEVSLNFSGVGLPKIKSDFIRTSELLALHLDNNRIETVSVQAFRKTPHLHYLDLSGNNIATSQLLFLNYVSNLRTLIIDNNNSSESSGHLAEYPEKIPRLNELSLRNNNIVEFNIDVKEFAPVLTHLHLSGNRISSTAFLSTIPHTLTHLSLGQNLIEQIDADALVNILELNLRENRIEVLCGEDCSDSTLSLGKATKLQKLDLSGNRISDIPEDTFKHLTRLTELNLSNNRISRVVNGTFEGQTYLEHLAMSHNELVQIPSICALRRLKTLDLSYNQITEVNGGRLCDSQTLKTLLLNNNRIISIQTFQIGTSMDILDLSHNLLDDLPRGWIAPSRSLRTLMLNNNNITDSGKLHVTTDIAELHLEENPLMFVVANHLCSYPPNLFIHLKLKPLVVVEEKSEVEIGADDADDSNYF